MSGFDLIFTSDLYIALLREYYNSPHDCPKSEISQDPCLEPPIAVSSL